MKKFVAIAALAAAFAAPAALADHHGKKTFADIDTNADGAITLTELQAVKPEVTAEKFAKYDTDASGGLSEAELDAWKAKKAEKAAKEGAKTE